MTQIFHKVTIEVPKDIVLKNITNPEQLKKWWMKETSLEGDGEVGSKLKFNFGPEFYNIMEITEKTENKIIWKVIENKGNEESNIWQDTIISFELQEKQLERLQGKTVTILRFKHDNWKGEENDFYADCNYHWAYFLHSLKNLSEGKEAWPM